MSQFFRTLLGQITGPPPAIPWIFLRAGVNQFSDTGGTTPSTEGGAVANWGDSRTNGRFFVSMDSTKPKLNSGRVKWDGVGNPLRLQPDATSITDYRALAQTAVMMVGIQTLVSDPPTNPNGLWSFNTSGGEGTYYTKHDGHIYESFGGLNSGGGSAHDFGDPSVALDTEHSYEVGGDGSIYFCRIDGIDQGDSPLLPPPGPRTFTGGPWIGMDHLGWPFLGWIRHLVIFDFVPTDDQLAAWRPFLKGDTNVSPID